MQSILYVKEFNMEREDINDIKANLQRLADNSNNEEQISILSSIETGVERIASALETIADILSNK